MQQIKIAVGQRDTFARPPPLLDLPVEFVATQNFAVLAQ
jgi:hypothetical protein